MRKILVLDDCESIRLTLGAILTRSGYSVSFARNSAEALAVLERNPTDLLLLDVMMPGVSGLGFLAILRANARWKTLPVLVVTARADAATRASARDMGAGDVLIKSHYSNKELIARIASKLSLAA